MQSELINVPRVLWTGLAAGVWVVVSGLLMAGVFGYREMKAAFDSIGLPVSVGPVPFAVHTVVRLLIGMTVVLLFALLSRVLSPNQAMLTAAGVTWLLGALLPFVVMAEWGLFPLSLGFKLWAWSAGELLVAGWIGRWLYAP